MKIGILASLESQLEELTHSMTIIETRTIGLRDYYIGTLYGKDVVVVFARWGRVSASTAALMLVEIFRVEKFIFLGLAGRVDEKCSIGDIIIGNKFIQYDIDVTALTGSKFEIPLPGISEFFIDNDLCKKSLEILKSAVDNGSISYKSKKVDIKIGTIATGGKFITSKNESNDILCGAPDTLCVDMEGAGIAHIADEYAIPSIICRIISDSSDKTAVEDFTKFATDYAPNMLKDVMKTLILEDF